MSTTNILIVVVVLVIIVELFILLFSEIKKRMVTQNNIAETYNKKEEQKEEQRLKEELEFKRKLEETKLKEKLSNKEIIFPDNKCPFCLGDIEKGIKKCKHCGEWLDEEHQKREEEIRKAQLETALNVKSTNYIIKWIVFLFFSLPTLLAIILKGCH